MVDVPNDCVVPQIWWSYVPFHKADTFSGDQPSTIQDFFDVEKFPGKRGVHTWANAIVEMALYADGVAIPDIYDVLVYSRWTGSCFCNMLDSIKDHVVFWSSGAKPLDLVNSGEVSMSLAYNGRIGGAVLNDGADYVTVWDGQVLEEEWLVLDEWCSKQSCCTSLPSPCFEHSSPSRSSKMDQLWSYASICTSYHGSRRAMV